jgi:hypothetical protein
MLFLWLVFLLINHHFQRGNQFQSGFRRVDNTIHVQIGSGGIRVGKLLAIFLNQLGPSFAHFNPNSQDYPEAAQSVQTLLLEVQGAGLRLPAELQPKPSLQGPDAPSTF